MVLGVLTTIAVARTLGPEGRGWIATATTLAGMGTILGGLGLPQVNAYYGAKEPQLRGKLLGNSLAISAMVTLVLGGLFCLGARLAPEFIRLPGAFLPLTVGYAGLQLALTLVQNLLISMDKVRAYNLSEIAVRGLQLLGIAGLSGVGFCDSKAYFASSALAFVPVLAGWSWWCSRRIEDKVCFSSDLLKRSAAYSSRLYAIAVFYNTFVGLDILMTQMYLGVEQAGIFSIAGSMRQILLVFTLVVQTLLLPRLVRLESAGERLKLTYKYAGLTAVATSSISLAAYLLADPMVVLLFGAEFLPSTSALAAMLPGYIMYSVAGVLAVVLQASGQPWYSVAPMAFTLLAQAGACMSFIPRWGLVGGSWAYSLACGAYLVLQALAVAYYRRLGAFHTIYEGKTHDSATDVSPVVEAKTESISEKEP